MENLEDALYGAYEIPNNVPTEVESTQKGYYVHPAGTYKGVIGSLEFKFKDAEGNKCDMNYPGAVPTWAVLKVLLKSYLGDDNAPNKKEILGETLNVPEDMTAPELYFPIILSLQRKDQWQTERKFKNFKAPGLEDSEIVKGNVVRFNKFPLYYGLNVKMVAVKSPKSGKSYISSIALLDMPREDIEKVKNVEQQVRDKLSAEIEASKQNRDYVAPVPDKSVDDILAGTNIGTPDTGEFSDVTGADDDLPF